MRPELFKTIGPVGCVQQTVELTNNSFRAGKLGADELGGRNHVGQGRLHLCVLAGLETTVRVHP